MTMKRTVGLLAAVSALVCGYGVASAQGAAKPHDDAALDLGV